MFPNSLYIAGITESNLPDALEAAKYLAAHEHIPLISYPSLFYPQTDHTKDEENENGYSSIIKVCDGIVMMPGWRDLDSAWREYQIAILCRTPIYYFTEKLELYYSDPSGEKKCKS